MLQLTHWGNEMTHRVDSSRSFSACLQDSPFKFKSQHTIMGWSPINTLRIVLTQPLVFRAAFTPSCRQYAFNYESVEYGGGEASFWFIVHQSSALLNTFVQEALLLQSSEVRNTLQVTCCGLLRTGSLRTWLTGRDEDLTAKATGWENQGEQWGAKRRISLQLWGIFVKQNPK